VITFNHTKEAFECELRGSRRTIRAAFLPFWGAAVNHGPLIIGNHLLRCRVIASLPCQELGHALPGPIQPDGNDNPDVAITHIRSADNRAPLVFASDGAEIGATLAVFSTIACQRIASLRSSHTVVFFRISPSNEGAAKLPFHRHLPAVAFFR
jgi:hypothetical protein